MKKLLLLVLMVSPLIMAFQCDSGEGCEPMNLNKYKPNLITIENLQNTYNVGDIIWLNSTLERNQIFENPNETIDLFSFPLDFEYGIQFYKSSIYNPEIYLCLDNNTTEITQGYLNLYSCNLFVYEKTGDFLKSRVGIKLLESGNYKISVYNIATFRETGLTCGDTGLNIQTTFNNNQESINFVVQ